MSCDSSKSTITVGTGPGQSAAAYDLIRSALLRAGWTQLLALANNTGAAGGVREGIFRMPALDSYNSHVDYLFMSNQNGTSILQLSQLMDARALTQSAATWSTYVYSVGGAFAGGTFPTTGTPALVTGSGTPWGTCDFSTGATAWTLRTVISEYGLVVCLDNGTNQALIY